MSHYSLFILHYGDAAVFLLSLLESACIPIASEVVLPYAGYLVHQGTLSLWPIIFIATIANVVGGIIAYLVGRYGGRAFIGRYGRYIFLNHNHMSNAEKWFAKHGELTVLIGRLIPVLRTFISLPAGIAKMKFGRFVLFSFIGALPWNILLTYAGFQLASNWNSIGAHLKPLTYLGGIIFVVVLILFWRSRQSSDKVNN